MDFFLACRLAFLWLLSCNDIFCVGRGNTHGHVLRRMLQTSSIAATVLAATAPFFPLQLQLPLLQLRLPHSCFAGAGVPVSFALILYPLATQVGGGSGTDIGDISSPGGHGQCTMPIHTTTPFLSPAPPWLARGQVGRLVGAV